MEMAGLSSPGELEVLHGSPPSQGVSMAGKQRTNDRRNTLFCEDLRQLRGLYSSVCEGEPRRDGKREDEVNLHHDHARDSAASGWYLLVLRMNPVYLGLG